MSTVHASSVSPSSYTNTIINQSVCMLSRTVFYRHITNVLVSDEFLLISISYLLKGQCRLHLCTCVLTLMYGRAAGGIHSFHPTPFETLPLNVGQILKIVLLNQLSQYFFFLRMVHTLLSCCSQKVMR